MADLGLKQAADAAWLKLRAALPIEMRAQAEFVRQRILVDARGWRDQARAIRTCPGARGALARPAAALRVCPSGNAASERIVEPLGLVARGSVWYLVADRDDQRRTYRVSRIANAAVLAEPSRRPADFDLAAHWERAATEFRDKLPRFYATLLASREALPRVRYYNRRVEEETDHGDQVRLRMRFDAEEEALQFALALGTSVVVLEPEALRARVLATAESLVRRYGSDVTPPV